MSLLDLPHPTEGRLERMLRLEKTGHGMYRGRSTLAAGAAAFEGLIAAQSLLAAERSAPSGYFPRSLHTFFVEAPVVASPTTLHVDDVTVGESSILLRVTATQGERLVASTEATFADADIETSRAAAETARDDMHPDDCLPARIPAEIGLEMRRPLVLAPSLGEPTRLWLRPADDSDHSRLPGAAVMALMLRIGLNDGDRAPDGTRTHADLAVWFHSPVTVDDWTFLSVRPIVASGDGTFCEASAADRSGRPLATAALESSHATSRYH